MPIHSETCTRNRRRSASLRTSALALALALIAPAALSASASASTTEPAAAQSPPGERRPQPVPDREELRRRVEAMISLEELLAAESRAKVDEAPISFRCEEVLRLPGGQAVSPRRSSRLTFLDARGLCYGACMLACMGVGVPFDDCDEVCDDVCYGGTATVASAPAPDPERAEAELAPLTARGARIVSPRELAEIEPRRLLSENGTSFRCNRAACICTGALDCLALIDAGLCADLYCSMGPDCACNRKPGT